MLKLFGSGKPNHPLADPKEARRILDGLPANDPHKALEELAHWLDSASTAEGFKPQDRIQVLTMVDDAAQPRVRKLGLGDGSRIVVYDANRFFASARVWWLFRLMGHEEVLVLDGGLEKWRAEGRPVTDMPTRPQERHFTVRQNTLLHRELDQIRANLTTKREQVVDARSAGRFHAREPEPRAGLRSGHIPGSRNLHYASLIAADGTLKQTAELRDAVTAAGVDPARPVVTTCGSGVSAAIINLALFELGARQAALYDGSWSEWGAQADTPVAS